MDIKAIMMVMSNLSLLSISLKPFNLVLSLQVLEISLSPPFLEASLWY